MKRFHLLLFLLLGISLQLSAQNSLSFRAAYYGHIVKNPGLKIGLEFPVKSWESKQLFVNPQLAVFSFIRSHTNFSMGNDLGFRLQKEGKKHYSAFSIGTAYVFRLAIVSESVDLGSGSTSYKRESLHFFLPTIKYEFGRAINERMAWYLKPSAGYFLSAKQENELAAFLEIGLRLSLN